MGEHEQLRAMRAAVPSALVSSWLARCRRCDWSTKAGGVESDVTTAAQLHTSRTGHRTWVEHWSVVRYDRESSP